MSHDQEERKETLRRMRDEIASHTAETTRIVRERTAETLRILEERHEDLVRRIRRERGG